MELNPENEVIKATREHWHTIAGLLLFKYGPFDGQNNRMEARIGVEDVKKFGEMFDGDMPCTIIEVEGVGEHEEIVLRLLPFKEGEKLAKADALKKQKKG